jgi:hypothetical protein
MMLSLSPDGRSSLKHSWISSPNDLMQVSEELMSYPITG